MGRLFDNSGVAASPSAGSSPGVEGRLFNSAGHAQPGMEKLVLGPVMPYHATPMPDPVQVKTLDLGSQLLGQSQGAETKLATNVAKASQTYDTAHPAPPPATPGEIINKSLAQVGHTILGGFKPAAPVAPPKPTNIISQMGDLLNSTADKTIPMLPAAKTFAGSKAGQGVALGTGSLAVGLLAGLNDPFNYASTTSDQTDAKLRQAGTIQNGGIKANNGVTNVKPYTQMDKFKADAPNDIATGLLGRLMFAGGAVGKVVTSAGLGLFGLSVVKDTPAYVQQIMQTPDVTEKFSLATQLLGSYLLLGHGAKTIEAAIPRTKTIPGGPQEVSIDHRALSQFVNHTNPDITPQQHQAFTDLFAQREADRAAGNGSGVVRKAVVAGKTTITTPDVTVPNFYGELINSVRAKLARKEPLTPAEQAVQAAVVVSPHTLVPKPSDLVSDPPTLQAILKMQSDSITSAAPAEAGIAQLATFKNPHLGLEQAPATAISPAAAPTSISYGADRPIQPTAGLVPVGDLTRLAISNQSATDFTSTNAQINPEALRGFKQLDGSIINGKGTAPQTASVLDPRTKSIVDQPIAKVLTEFYYQARGEVMPAQTPGVTPVAKEPTQTGSKTFKNVIKTKDQVQAAIDAQQRAANAPPAIQPTPKTFKTRARSTSVATATGQTRLDQLATEHASELQAMHKDTGGVARIMTKATGAEGDKYSRQSLNSMFYRKFYKDNGKAPLKQDWIDHAHAQLKAGKGEGLHTGDPKIAEYQKIDAQLNPAKSLDAQDKEMADLVAGIKFKVEDSGKAELTTRVLTALGDRTSVNRQFIENLLKGADIKKAERQLTEKVLQDIGNPATVDVAAFRDAIKTELLPLRRDVGYGDETSYERVHLPTDDRGDTEKYHEIIYESPISNSAGNVHFGIMVGGEAPENYFAHVRADEINGTRRILEVQSDLFQKGNYLRDPALDGMYMLKSTIADGVYTRLNWDDLSVDQQDALNKLDALPAIDKELAARTPEQSTITANLKHLREIVIENGAAKPTPAYAKEIAQNIANMAQLKPYHSTWHERIIREEVARAAVDGKTTLQFPSGETAMKIEGLGTPSRFVVEHGIYLVPEPELTISKLKVGLRIAGNSNSWIITQVGENGKFKAATMHSLASSMKAENDNSFYDYAEKHGAIDNNGQIIYKKVPLEAYKLIDPRDTESFDLSSNVDTSNPIYKYYESDVQKFLKRIKPEMQVVTDAQGITWYEIPVSKSDGNSVLAYKVDAASPTNLRSVKQGASYLQQARGSAPFEFTNKPLSGGAAATFDQTTKMVSAALTPDSKLNIMHVGHEVGHEIFADLLTAGERTEFAAIIRSDYKGTPEVLAHKIASYNYFDLPHEYQGILDYAMTELRANGDPTILEYGSEKQAGYAQLSNAYTSYAENVAAHGQSPVNISIKQTAPESGRALVKFLSDVHDQVTNKTYSDTVMEEIFSDMNGEYVAGRTGKWSDQLKTWFSDLWNGIKKAFGADYNKMQEIFKRSYEGQYKADIAEKSSELAKKPENGGLIRAKVVEERPIQGLESHSRQELKDMVEGYITQLDSNYALEGINNFEITNIEFTGSRSKGVGKKNSDLDVLVEYKALDPSQKTPREDDLFNAFNEKHLRIDGIKVDINPITPEKSGTISEYKKINEQPTGKYAPANPKMKLEEDPGLWEARFAEAAQEVSNQLDEQSKLELEIFGKQGNPGYRTPPAMENILVGDFRELTDKESTPGNDHEMIIRANPAITPKAIVQNYDGLLELRKLKTEERLRDIFKGVTKDDKKQLFEAAKAYQVAGETNAEHKLTPELAVIFNKVTKLYEAVAQDAYASGRIRAIRENYITQIWDNASLEIPDTSLTPAQINFLRGASATTTRFGLEKVVKSYNDGIALGLKPKYDNLEDLLREYLLADARAAVGQFLASDMVALGDEHILATANGLAPGWKAINKLSGLKGYSVSPEAYKALKGLESISGIRETKLGRAAVKVSQTTTQIIMAGDFLLLKNYFFDAPKASTFGLVRLMVENAGMTPEIRADLVAFGGLKLSEHRQPEMSGNKFSNSKMGKVVALAMDEKKNPYFFADFLSFRGGDMLRNGTSAMIYKERIKAGDSRAVAAQKAVRFAQDTFGRQNLIRAGRSQTVQDVMRVAMISPDYTESRFKFMGKAAAGATYKIRDRESRRYTAGFLRYLFFGALLLETLNFATSGHATTQNDEDHKFDWEWHNPDGSKYYVNLLGVMKADLRFINGIADATQGNFTTATKFLSGKGSSIERVIQMLITNKDYRGNDVVNNFTDSPLEKWQKLAIGTINNFIPLPLQGFTTPSALYGPAPKGFTGFVLRTLGFDLINPKAIPTAARQSLTELENTKQQVQLDVYSLIRQGKGAEAQKEIDAFNKKANAVGLSLSTLTNISPTDKQSLLDLGKTAAIDSVKLLASAQKSADSGAKPNPISSLIDYGVGGTTISSNKSVTGKATAKANAVKSAATRRARKPAKARIAKARKPKTFKVKRMKVARVKTFKSKKRII